MTSHIHALAVELYGRRRPLVWLRFFRTLMFGNDGRRALVLIRLSGHFHDRGWWQASRFMQRKLRRDFGCFVKPEARIDVGLRLPHPQGVVIGSGVCIGRGCTIYHQVTLGGARLGDWQAGRYPRLGNGITLFAGAKIVGAVDVGDGALVGANAVVSRDVPARHVARGIPARCEPLTPPAGVAVELPVESTLQAG